MIFQKLCVSIKGDSVKCRNNIDRCPLNLPSASTINQTQSQVMLNSKCIWVTIVRSHCERSLPPGALLFGSRDFISLPAAATASPLIRCSCLTATYSIEFACLENEWRVTPYNVRKIFEKFSSRLMCYIVDRRNAKKFGQSPESLTML